MQTGFTEEKEAAHEWQTRSDAPKKHRGYLVAAILGVLFLAAAVVGIASRFSENRALAKETEELAVPTVSTIQPKAEPPQEALVLPSTLQAFIEAPIYARTNGYLKKWYKDIGSRVRQGELLADIETPEIDQELLQAKAAREQASAQVEIAKTSAKRWENLQKMDAVAQQETDERNSGYAQAQANLSATEANVRRLEQLESFKHVYAPFSGVITKRNVDIGALINAGNTGPNQQMFNIAQTDPIRVYVSVPEVYAGSVRPGVKATIQLTSADAQAFSGKVVRNSESIDQESRTLLTEIDVPNPQGRLLPGAYAQVHFALSVDVPRLTIPVNAMMTRPEGTLAAVVDSNSKVQLKPIVIGRDYGREIEVLSGLHPSDQVVLNPSDSLESGQQVTVKQPRQQGGVAQ
ncbi:MAG TPA: efflux RND transporter periplasmic adaptor subunit [Terriglobales bacterium]|jgi:RND family efflux transporter MFP subunit|nr:efflux RND transporter periplasmic adaptor subunit [Terriglobales bacterium]